METIVEKEKREKAGVGGYIALVAGLLIFSGLLQKIPILNAFDLTKLIGAYGAVKGAEGNFTGSGGCGARDGFLLCFSVLPTLMVCMGLVEVIEHYRGLIAAQRLLSPVLRFFIGVPGNMALSVVASLNSSDAGSVTTRGAFDSGMITEEERVKMIAFQWPACGLIGNLVVCYGMGGEALKISMGAYILIFIVFKLIYCTVMRLILKSGLYYGKNRKTSTSSTQRDGEV